MYKKKSWRRNLVNGRMYSFKVYTYDDENQFEKKFVVKRMKLIRKYRHFALFESKHGIRECFLWQDIDRMLKNKGACA